MFMTPSEISTQLVCHRCLRC
uniref:Uncharacterized protein n=1 Tax=Anguilla anguilla TaxID=7936 RepID=A0A0E9W7B4_ANGAN